MMSWLTHSTPPIERQTLSSIQSQHGTKGDQLCCGESFPKPISKAVRRIQSAALKPQNRGLSV
jgi:hypothetical protein